MPDPTTRVNPVIPYDEWARTYTNVHVLPQYASLNPIPPVLRFEQDLSPLSSIFPTPEELIARANAVTPVTVRAQAAALRAESYVRDNWQQVAAIGGGLLVLVVAIAAARRS